MKKFSKFFAVFACFVMVLSFTAFAANSPSTGDNSGTQKPSTGAQSPIPVIIPAHPVQTIHQAMETLMQYLQQIWLQV